MIIPGPHWWQNRLCLNIAHDTKIEFTNHTVQYRGTSLRWLIYSAALEAERNGMSLNFLPPLLNVDPPFHVWTSDEETSMAPYCVEEVEDQWLHPWFRVNSVTPHALAFCPSLLKLLRLKLFLSPLYDNDHLWHEINNSYQIVCVFYYCRTYYKAVRVGGGGEWRTCAMRDDEPRPVWMSLLITH